MIPTHERRDPRAQTSNRGNFGNNIVDESEGLCDDLSVLAMLTILAANWNSLIRDLQDLANDVDNDVFFALTEGKREQILERLGRIARTCRSMELEFSASYVDEIATDIAQGVSLKEQSETVLKNINARLQGNPMPPDAQSTIDRKTLLDPTKVKADIAVLRKRINDELKGGEFFALDQRTGEYFKKDKLFGEEVFSNFPSANNDIYEAGTCLALGRATACVMHSMRVVEVGLTVLAKELLLPTRNNWGKNLTDVENELTKRYKASGSRTPDELFFAEAAAQIGHIKTAWRNPTMHVDRAYSEKHAEEILLAVRSLMCHLATRLHE
jgi:hypothetical protein